jgi:NADPH:quinone reductase-like Zn-dependent oxidoreductase/acyl carrier protein
VGLAPWPVQVAQAPLWGLARTIAVEQPLWRSGVIDVDPAEALDDVGRLLDDVNGLESENQVAWRADARFAARLVRKRRSQPGERRLAVPAGDAFQLTTSARGVIDNLCFVPRPRPEPGPGEVEVRVHAGGLNFRDVLGALGMYPGDPGPMGGESAGRVSRVGAGVSDLQVGDDVMCMAGGSFGRYVITPRQAVVRLPAGLTYEQGASIPITFLTAHYGLHHLARIKKGDRVLVHAAAGGVGQAAVQIALRAGAVVYGTAGSVEKREFVRTLGVSRVFSSRTADFTEQLMSLTGGEGVDVVLNSLTGAFIPESFKVLKAGGHFLEIGKAEIWTPEAVAAVNPGAAYHPFDLGDVLQREPETIARMFADIVAGLADGTLRPLPIRIFDVRDAQSAFRFMAQAKHVGKLVLSQRDLIVEETGSGCDAGGTYLVTGGAGGLGVKVAEWLVARNARHLVLTGRSAPSAEAARAIESMRANGATVTFAQADIAVEADVRRVLGDIAATPYPLRGIVHAAGVLDDGLLAQMNWARFRTVMAPKVRGGWLLHQLTQRDRLDFFVLFSSTSAVLGAPGQSNYAAANAFLDGLAQFRRAQGAPALSVNWGAWSDVGMAARLQGRDQSRIADRGIGSITPEQGVRALGMLLNQPEAHVTVLPVRWQKFFDGFPGAVPPMLRVVAKGAAQKKDAGQAAAAAGGGLKAQLATASAGDRREMLLAFVREQVAKVLGLDSGEAIDPQLPFTSLGLDSLMAVEMRNAIASAIDQTLPASLIFDHPTVEQLAEFIGESLAGSAAAPASAVVAAATAADDSAAAATLLSGLDQMSEDRIDELLNSMLADQEKSR